MRIGIIIYPLCSMWNASAPLELFRRANKVSLHFSGIKAPKVKFEPSFVSFLPKAALTGFSSDIPVYDPEDDRNYDLLIIPGFEQQPDRVLEQSTPMLNWVKEKYRHGVRIVSFCSGSTLLAQSGLIQERLATTHWLLKDYFEARFPEIPLDLSKTYIEYDDILMSGSAASFQQVVLLLIERLMGRTVAVGVSKIYLIDLNPSRPDSYMNLCYERRHTDRQILHAQEYIKKHYQQRLTVDEVADASALNKRTFIRRFKKALNDTPLNYINRMKVERAKHILENERHTFEEIAFNMGYEDVSAFRKIFVKCTGVSPMEYRARYQVIE